MRFRRKQKLEFDRVKEIEVRYSPPTTKPYRSFRSRIAPYVHAKMSAWALTEKGHEVWLENEHPGPGGLDAKIKRFEESHKKLIGKTIAYALLPPPNEERGFYRFTLKENAQELKGDEEK